MRDTQVVQDMAGFESFEAVTEEEILALWRTFKASGLSAKEAWNAIITGMTLDMVFARTEKLKWVLSRDN